MPFPRNHLAALVAATSLLTGCAGEQLTVSNYMVTSEAEMAKGKRTPVSQFGLDDYIVQLTDITWQNTEQDGGRHEVNWEWYNGDKLVSKSGSGIGHTYPMLFRSSPWTLKTERAASTIGAGPGKVETIVDGKVIATSEFDVK